MNGNRGVDLSIYYQQQRERCAAAHDLQRTGHCINLPQSREDVIWRMRDEEQDARAARLRATLDVLSAVA